jgi:hypothetical protein
MATTVNPWTVLSAIVSGAQDAIIGQALDGTIASWNGGAESVLGGTSLARSAPRRNTTD